MTDQDVLEARQKRFHVANNPVRTLEDARKFIADVGFCLVYPLRHSFPAPLPTFMGAFIGTDQAVPYQHIAFADPRAKEATELMVRLLRDKAAYEVNFHEDSALLVSAEIFPYYYGVIGEKGSVKLAPKLTGAQAVSRIAFDIYNAIEKHGALTKAQLRGEYLERGNSISDAGMDRALHELWSALKITRVDYSPNDGSSWDLLTRWASDAVKQGSRISAPMALSAVISRYLQGVVAAEEKEVEEFIARFSTRSRAVEMLRALISAREVLVGAQGENGKVFYQVAHEAPEHAALMQKPVPKKSARKQPRPTHLKSKSRAARKSRNNG